jgi:hypothetical protein
LGRAQAHRNKLVKKRRQAAKFGEEKNIIRAAFDYKLRPQECHSILVEGYFQDDREWLVEKNSLANTNDSHFIVPNTLISFMNPYIPITNPTNQPRMIRKGEAVGRLTDPTKFFDTPTNVESRKKYEQAATAMSTVIKSNWEREKLAERHAKHIGAYDSD